MKLLLLLILLASPHVPGPAHCRQSAASADSTTSRKELIAGADSANSHGVAAFRQKKYVEAIEFFKNALGVYHRLNGAPLSEAIVNINLGRTHVALTQYDDALRSYEKALDLYRGLHRTNEIASTISRIGITYHRLEQYEKAIACFHNALDSLKGSKDDETMATIWFNMGFSCRYNKQFQKAIMCFDESYQLNLKRNIPKKMADDLLQMGCCYSALRLHEPALTSLREAVRQYPDEVDDADALFEIGDVYAAMGHYETALPYHSRALRFRLREAMPITGDIPPEILKSVIRMKSIYQSVGQTDTNEISIVQRAIEEMKIEMEAVASLNAGLEEHKKDDFRASLGHVLNAMRISEKIRSTGEEKAAQLGVAGLIYGELKQWEDARAQYEQQLTLWRKCGTADQLAECLAVLSEVYMELKTYDRALLYSQEAVSLYRVREIAVRNAKVKREEYAESIASLLDRQGDIHKSTKLFEAALACYEQAHLARVKIASPDMLKSGANISALYDKLGQKKSMTSILKGAMEKLKAEEEAKALNVRGAEAVYSTRYVEAGTLFAKSLAICKREKFIDGESSGLINMGALYHSVGEHEKALAYYDSALNLAKNYQLVREVPFGQFNVGEVYRSLGKYEQALTAESEALKLFREYRMTTEAVACLNGIGFIRYLMGQYDRALENHREALAVSEEAQNIAGIHRSLVLMGFTHLAKKEFGESEKALLRAKKFRSDGQEVDKASLPVAVKTQASGGLSIEGLVGKSGGAAGLAEVYLALGLHDKLLSSLEEAPAAWESDAASRMEYHTLKGLALKGKGLKKEASHEFLKAVVLSENTRAGVKDRLEFLGAGYGGGRIRAYRNLTEVLSERVLAGEKKDGTFDAYGRDLASNGLYFSELTKARVLLESLAKGGREGSAPILPGGLQAEGTVPLNRIPMLEYAVCDNATYVYVITANTVKKLSRIRISRTSLEEKVKALLDPLTMKRAQGFSMKQARELYDLLLSDALKTVGAQKRITIIPDGILCLLPFEILAIDEARKIHVCDRYEINYSQSASLTTMPRRTQSREPDKELFALGNPIFDKSDKRYVDAKHSPSEVGQKESGGPPFAYRGFIKKAVWGGLKSTSSETAEVYYPPLPETEEEVKAIAALFKTNPTPPDILLGVNANETGLRQVDLGRYRILHFATHADLPGRIQAVQEPFLLLGQLDNTQSDDGFLSLSEVMDLTLNADLVVLSACLTGIGKQIEGEGVVNMSRAFLQSGARSVLVSLWEVASVEIVEYMKMFYGHLRAGKGKAEALALARQEMRRRYPNPFFWGVFVLHGEG
jgi:CHAT domain-containing protein/tetratricopeptide (TPR) repeat protein